MYFLGFIGRLLSSQIFTSTSKLVNCVLLLHPLVSRIFVLSSDTVVHLSFSIIVSDNSIIHRNFVTKLLLLDSVFYWFIHNLIHIGLLFLYDV